MKEQFDKLDKKTDNIYNKLDSLGSRITVLESEVCEVKNEQRTLQQQQRDMEVQQNNIQSTQEDQAEDIHALQEDMSCFKNACFDLKECTERLKKASNIIIHGVKEDSRALPTITRLMNIIFPRNTLHIRDLRIGNVTPNKIRPVRLRLGSANEVDAVLYKTNMLKDRSEYTGIYVTRDLTRMQQAEKKQRREEWKKQQVASQSNQPLILPANAPDTDTSTIPLAALVTTTPKRKAGEMASENTLAAQPFKHFRMSNNTHESSPDITDI